tara:strand:+ start:183 stop:1853 length:1671 start_codon:yes stop_codon:yes gene_type:complete
MDMCRKAALAVILVMMFSFGSFSSMQSVGMQDTFETQGRQALQTNFSAYHEEVKQFVETWNLPGAQLAIVYNGTIVFDESYGVEDLTTQEPVTSDSRFRIASLSKAITAAAIQTLVVRGNISLNDKVVDLIPDLVPGNLDGCAYPFRSDSNRFYASHIEVGHLLNHTSGLVTNLTGWHYAYDWVDTDTKPAPVLNEGVNNPCIDHVTVSQEYDNGTLAPVKVETMIRETLRLPLNSQPGTVYNYSNIGYRILGEIIERQCNCTFENYVRYYLLGRMNIHDMQLGKTLIEDRAENEVTYHPVDSQRDFSYFPQLNGDINDNTETNLLVNVSFGNSSSPQSHSAYGGSGSVMETLEASGGWISNASNYAKFITYYEGLIPHPYLSTNSLAFAQSNPAAIPNSTSVYGDGMRFNPNNPQNFWHTGSLQGTATRYERYSIDNTPMVVVFLTNTNPNNWTSPRNSLMDNASLTIDFANLTCDKNGMMDASCHWDPVACEWVCVQQDWFEDPNLPTQDPALNTTRVENSTTNEVRNPIPSISVLGTLSVVIIAAFSRKRRLD